MLTVYKYEVPVEDMVELYLPEGAQFLSFQNQYGHPTLWCLVDTKKPPVRHRFRFSGTGHPLDPMDAKELQYIGTAQFSSGSLVFHLFYVKP